ncbi:aspartyl/asparaginyl beta-hydroxylase isoform X2 [Sphaeramia orbicularis]|uniref:aspartyl/asparaginyl beta-hydroxylase isoform X2 n=1 Tax=Sphaeramia orbicularis TaxID=375764 RepID=UPI001180B189|nr:aspartyl/asparaginyl beta-hydroxylase-like isoform X2 [Sphaeramia orbicularis]
MQHYRHYGTSSSSSSAPVEEIHTEAAEEEEEVYTEEEEGLEAGGVQEEEEVQPVEADVQPVVMDTEVKTPPVESKNGKKTEGGGAGGGAGGGPKYSVFTWVVVLGLLGVWSSMAVVYFDIVDYDSVIARAKEFRLNFSDVLQGKLMAYDTDGDGDFDVEDAKVLLGLKEAEPGAVGASPETTGASERIVEPTNQQAAQQQGEEPKEATSGDPAAEETPSAAVPLPSIEDDFIPDDPREDVAHPYEDEVDTIDTTGVLVEEPPSQESIVDSGRYVTSSEVTQESEPAVTAEEPSESPAEPPPEPEQQPEPVLEPEPVLAAEPEPAPEPEQQPQPEPEPVLEPESQPQTETRPETGSVPEAEGSTEKLKEKAKKKKPKLFNKFDKTIKAEIDAAEKLRKKGKVDEALRAFESLVQQYPQSPRARYGKAQAEDDVAEKLRSNDMLQRAINTYREAAELPDATSDLLMAALKRRAERQQFLGRMRGSLVTLERLVQIFPEDISLKNDLGVAHLLLGDNKGAKKVYEQVLAAAPNNGFAKVHYGFILKSENKIAESIPYLKEGLESGEPGTDDGRFYFHLGDALQRVGDNSAYHWYELGHQRGHFASVWQRSLYNVEGLKAQPWWTPKETGYTDLVKMLERNWKTIRDEALAVMDRNTGQFIPEEENLREKGEWGQYTLWQQGKKVGNSCQGVPKTCSLLEKHPEATGCKRGQIKFSVMHPGTHVWPHTGPTNCRLRMHLGLVIPKQGCRIRCTTETRQWEEGKVLIFDDSFEHEVWQDADSYRLIFIVDVWHPELTAYQRQTLSPI